MNNACLPDEKERSFSRSEQKGNSVSQPVVYITQLSTRREGSAWVPTVDITPAKEFGDLVYLLPSGMNYPSLGEVLPVLQAGLAKFRHSQDMVLPMGDPTVIMAVGAILGAAGDSFKLLKWDRKSHRYFIQEIYAQ